MAEKGKKENRRHTGVWQGFLTQNFFVRTSRKIQDLIWGTIILNKALSMYKESKRALDITFYSAVVSLGENVQALCTKPGSISLQL